MKLFSRLQNAKSDVNMLSMRQCKNHEKVSEGYRKLASNYKDLPNKFYRSEERLPTEPEEDTVKVQKIK